MCVAFEEPVVNVQHGVPRAILCWPAPKWEWQCEAVVAHIRSYREGCPKHACLCGIHKVTRRCLDEEVQHLGWEIGQEDHRAVDVRLVEDKWDAQLHAWRDIPGRVGDNGIVRDSSQNLEEVLGE